MTTEHRTTTLARPSRRSFLKFAGLALMGSGLSGCTVRSETFRYKFTLSFNTPDGVKTGSTVGEITHSEVYGLEHGFPTYQRAQALFVDLGVGRKPLIATLNNRCIKSLNQPYCFRISRVLSNSDWRSEGPMGIFQKEAGLVRPDDWRLFDSIAMWKAKRARVDLKVEELPDLVTFKDINEPLSVQMVDPNHLEVTLGPGVSWNAMLVEITDDPVVFDIETKLPLLVKLQEIQKQKYGDIGLDGSEFGLASGPLENYLMLDNFVPWRD